ncbi:carbohydrate kinase [Chitinibacter tainanensis]|uniref:carbohydrate kinase family protein n=1 Tax=Chitinibacter tainanensis TaxID=230667 RepID=UPI00235566F6|nr:carbohydrate kinase [Chitinibacter tainanensis]
MFPHFIAAGEALTDLLRRDAQSWESKVGGATWNVARVLAKLGVPSAFAGAVSQDCFGDALLQASQEAGLDLRFIQQLPYSPLLAIVHQTQPPAYFFIGDNSADLHFNPEALPAGWLSASCWLHFGGISLARPQLAQKLLSMARQARAVGARISYDPNFRLLMDQHYDPVLREMSTLADVIKVSDDDLRGLFRTADEADALQQLRALNPSALILYTRGAAGASLLLDGGAWHLKPPKLAVIDTVGAGDASMGGLIWSMYLQADAPPQQHLAYAVAAGSLACTAAGAHPPSLADLRQLAAQIMASAKASPDDLNATS